MMDERYFTQKLLDSEAMLYRIACTLLRNEEDRRDALQETALKAWRARGQPVSYTHLPAPHPWGITRYVYSHPCDATFT